MTITPRSMKSFRYDAEALFPWSPADRPSAFKGGATSCTSTWWRVNCWAQAFGKMNQPKRPLETCEQMDRNGSETVYNCIVSHNDFRFSFNVSTLGLVFAWLFHISKNAVNQQVNFHQTSSEDLEDPAPLRNNQPMGGSFFSKLGMCFCFPQVVEGYNIGETAWERYNKPWNSPMVEMVCSKWHVWFHIFFWGVNQRCDPIKCWEHVWL